MERGPGNCHRHEETEWRRSGEGESTRDRNDASGPTWTIRVLTTRAARGCAVVKLPFPPRPVRQYSQGKRDSEKRARR